MAVAIDTLRLRVRVGGTVQGVGFRPFVYRLAVELGLAGWVRNDERGVQLEIEGTREATRAFLARLRGEAPPLASVEEVSSAVAAALGERGFRILPSAGRLDEPNAHVAADAATCEDCLREMRDPRDRRYRYPFINCTNCGPRFTIVRGVPYDRRRTTMSSFRMCPACRAEYENPLDRRFHAQPNACPVCGPRALLLRADGTRDRGAAHERARAGAGGDTIARAARLLADGAILAVKGLGGYHLACRADEQATVAALRARKRREDRPFALMVADLDAARDVAAYDGCAAELLCSLARPIVLASRREGAAVTAAVAPGSAELGVMLPYAPLHHLLLADARALGVDALVMTSGNLSDEPIAYLDEDARRRLRSVADAFLVHDRPVHMRTDDSVARSVRLRSRCRPQLLRRSRGYVPDSTPLPVGARRPLLACGAELKSTFCLARGDRAWVGHHIGDLRNWETLRSFREGIEHFQELFGVRPELIAHDLHPDYLSTRYATERAESAAVADGQPQLLAVQHHHAHLAAVLAEHGERGPAVAAIYDGAGHGTDGAVWGGELLVGDLRGFTRVGHLRPVPLPGGDAAAREPWRMACAWIAETTADPSPPLPVGLGGVVEERRWGALAGILGVRCTAPPTTSVGRLCDAVAAICGAGKRVSYEGQAAVELEAAADGAERGSYELPFEHGQLDARPLIAAVMSEIDAGVPRGTVAARFHNALALATASACVQVAREHDLSLVALGGGVFQNRLLIEAAARDIEHAGLRVLVPERLPPNDGAISYGQAAIAAASAA